MVLVLAKRSILHVVLKKRGSSTMRQFAVLVSWLGSNYSNDYGNIKYGNLFYGQFCISVLLIYYNKGFDVTFIFSCKLVRSKNIAKH